MGNWHELLGELQKLGSPHDRLRRKYLERLHEKTGRNIIAYYSGWLQKPMLPSPIFAINDDDKNGVMAAVNTMDRSLGVDLLLHTPGGDIAATESLVVYLRTMFGGDMRAIVPQIALSGGTMIACACKKIVMGKQSSLGPVDPQFGNIPAHGVIEEFERAFQEIKADPAKMAVWQPVIAKYHPTLIGECQKAIAWSETLVREWLQTGMLKSDPEAATKIQKIVTELTDHALTLSHARHLSADTCLAMGLDVEMMENDQELQDAILSLHHAYILTLAQTHAFKIIENQKSTAYILQATPGP